ncbi:MAG: 4Fe-4S dicluster domain-containing protein [Bacteroidales bacterium]|jgi:2-oxoglutarate ferredoxin oxidoreductase subunit delta
MAKVKGKIVVDVEMCKGCELCINTCTDKCIAMSKKVNAKGYNYAEVVNDMCTGCTNCAVVCPDGVITVYRVKLQ